MQALFIINNQDALALQDPSVIKGGRNLDKRLCFGVGDFRIGTFIYVYGRHLFLYDCDDFTRSWYQVSPQASSATDMPSSHQAQKLPNSS